MVKEFASANLQTLLVFGGESRDRTPDLRIMIPLARIIYL